MSGLGKVVSLYFIILISATKVDAFYNDFLNPVKDAVEVWSQQRSIRDTSEENDNIYICEEPPDTVPPESNRTCNFRNANYHEQIFKWVAGRGCLLYTPDFLYVDGVNRINLNTACIYGNLWAPCLEVLKEDGTYACYPFDPGLEEVATAVKNAIIPAAHGRWERCFEEATDCCTQHMAPYTSRNWYYLENLNEDEEIQERGDCSPTFDGWTCWPSTPGGTTAVEVCSEFAYSNQGPSCNHYSSKQCYENGTWEIQTDYSTCSITTRLLRRYQFYIAMLSLSIASCLPAVIIFFIYKRLRVTRVVLHRNLLIAIIIRNILVIISRSEIYIDELTNAGETVMSTHAVGCKILAVLERIAGNAVFVCMLVEGIYLHRMIVTTFRRKLKVKWLYAGGAVIAVLPVIAWSIVMGLLDDHSCWLVYTVDHIQWILDAPRLAVLLVNTGLFIDVLRVLLTKIRNSENAHQLSTTKATLFLMPIFGTQFLLTAFRPNTTNCTGEQIYYYVTYSVEGLQGFVVAMLYCYVNKEVHTLIKATYQKTENAVVSRVRGDAYGRPSLAPTSRRMTYSTNLPSHDDEMKENRVETPNLHVAEIISIKATERLAEILEPAYETVNYGHSNDGYNSSLDGYPAIRYSYTNASSISYDNEDWIRSATSPESSDYIGYRYGSDKPSDTKKAVETNELENLKDTNNPDTDDENAKYPENQYEQMENSYRFDDTLDDADREMIDEVFQSIDQKQDDVTLDPDLLSPNRPNEDKILFVYE